MIARAIARHVRSSARKIRSVTEAIVGLPVPRALTVLQFTRRGAAEHVARALKSAVSNAKQAGAQPQELVVSRAVADCGPTWKRFRAAAMGRATRIRKRTCHIVIELDAATAQRGAHGT